jgi:hypothetical protein
LRVVGETLEGETAMAQGPQPQARPRYNPTHDPLSDVASQAEDVASRVAQQGKLAGQGMHEVAGNFKGALDTSLRDQPMATLALVAIVGFVLGTIWKA